MNKELDKLLLRAKMLPPMTKAQRREQILSFAYGNVAIENPSVTQDMIERAAKRLGV